MPAKQKARANLGTLQTSDPGRAVAGKQHGRSQPTCVITGLTQAYKAYLGTAREWMTNLLGQKTETEHTAQCVQFMPDLIPADPYTVSSLRPWQSSGQKTGAHLSTPDVP